MMRLIIELGADNCKLMQLYAVMRIENEVNPQMRGVVAKPLLTGET